MTLAALLVGSISGVFLARQRFFGRSALVALLTFPLAFPGVVVGFLVILLAGRQGVFAALGMGLMGERWVFAYSLAWNCSANTGFSRLGTTTPISWVV